MHFYPLYGTEFSKLSTNDHINDDRVSYNMSSSNVYAAFIARSNAQARNDNLSMLHRPRKMYIPFG